MPSVSVIIPCFNQGQYLQEAVDSVLNQQLNEFEIIIVDDGSTHEINKSIYNLPNVRLFKQPNRGAAAARNFGVKQAKMDYVAFLDADDIWLPTKLMTQFEAMTQHKVDMVFTYIEQFISNELMTPALQKIQIKHQVTKGICPSTILICRRALERTGLFNETLKLGEFIAWYLKARAYRVKEHVVQDVLAKRRIHKNNTSQRNKAHRRDYLSILHARETECV